VTTVVSSTGAYDWAVPVADPNSVIGKVFVLFEAFRGTVGPIGVSELTRRTGLSKSTVFRLIRELVEVGAIVRVGDGYRIGLRLFELGSLHYPQEMRDAMQPFFEDLHLATGLAVISGVLDGGDVVFLEYYAPRRQGQRPGTLVGSTVPAHASACGKIMLAALPKAKLDRLLESPLAAVTEHTVTNPKALRAELDRIRRDDVAYEREEMAVGTVSVAVPIRSPKGTVTAGLAVSGPVKAVDAEKLLSALRVTASLIARAGSRAALASR
jgi:DNA-binding IclR family transcriptional regulator